MNKKEIIERFYRRKYLISPDFFDEYDGEEEVFFSLKEVNKPLILNKDLIDIFKKNNTIPEINWFEFEKHRSLLEKGRDVGVYKSFLDILSYDISEKKRKEIDDIVEEIKKPEQEIVIYKEDNVPGVIALQNFSIDKLEEKDVISFVNHFKFRYNFLKDILIQRPELINTLSINRVLSKKDKTQVSIIGMVQNKKITKNGNVLITLEDITGRINFLMSKDKISFDLAKNLVFDEVIGIAGFFNGEIIFGEKIYFPDIPITNELKKSPDESFVAFISDIHVGSKNFLEKEFLRFIDWLNLKYGNKREMEIARRLKYLVVVGDLVDGIGVFPDQERLLEIKDIFEQYNKLAEYINMIRKDIKIIMCPGDHDALRLAHPQPPLDKKIASKLWEINNLILVSNPALINIHGSKDFPGFDVLMYHGHGFHYYMDAVDSIKSKEPAKNPRYIMKFLLQKRHLAPSHTSTIYTPDNKEDSLVIKKAPDIFVSGHLHNSDVGIYNNVTTINSSCWQSATDFEIRVGNLPDPCKVPILNLKTREVEILNFND